jgi:hypothetical protein
VADRDRAPTERGIVALFHGREEGVHVDVDDLADGGRHHLLLLA